MKNEEVRFRLNKYLLESGVTSKWIAHHCSQPIPTDILSRFKNNKRDLYQESLEALSEYLAEQNY